MADPRSLFILVFSGRGVYRQSRRRHDRRSRPTPPTLRKPRRGGQPSNNKLLLIVIRGRRGGGRRFVAAFDPLVTLSLHFVPFLLLVGIQKSANLVAGCLVG